MERPTISQAKRRLAGPFDAKAFGMAVLAFEERGYTDDEMYRLALAGDDSLNRDEWADRRARAREALPFADLKPGDHIRAGGRSYKVVVVDHHAGVVELEAKSLLTLMPHGTEPGKFVISSARAARIVDSWKKVG